MNGRILLAGLLAIAALAGAFWLLRPAAVAPPAQPSAAAPDAAHLRRLQARADAACLCARRPGSDAGRCWASFEAEVGRFKHSRTDSYCMDASVSQVCFGDSFPHPDTACVSTRRSYGACSEAEERRLTAAQDEQDAAGCG